MHSKFTTTEYPVSDAAVICSSIHITGSMCSVLKFKICRFPSLYHLTETINRDIVNFRTGFHFCEACPYKVLDDFRFSCICGIII